MFIVISEISDRSIDCPSMTMASESAFRTMPVMVAYVPSNPYRELFEETGITKDDIRLFPMMELDYPFLGYDLEIFFGFLERETELTEEVNPLTWVSADDDFTDMERYAGAGNITHMVNVIRLYRKEVEAYSDGDF